MSAPCSFSERPNAKIAAVLEQLGGAAARGGVVALPDRAEPEDRDLPRVPVRQAVEAGDLAERADARGVPALVRVAGRLGGGRQQRREDALALDELEEVGVPGALVIVLLERRLAAGLEEVDRGQQRSPSRLVEVGRIVRAGVEQDGPRPFLRRWDSTATGRCSTLAMPSLLDRLPDWGRRRRQRETNVDVPAMQRPPRRILRGAPFSAMNPSAATIRAVMAVLLAPTMMSACGGADPKPRLHRPARTPGTRLVVRRAGNLPAAIQLPAAAAVPGGRVLALGGLSAADAPRRTGCRS